MGLRGAALLTMLVAMLALPAGAAAVRPATEAEVAELRAAAIRWENEKVVCGTLAEGGATASDESCLPPPRPGYDPTIAEARVSTLDEAWALAFVDPVPRAPAEAATEVFFREGGGWRAFKHGNDCSLGKGIGAPRRTGEPELVRDLVESMGCTPVIPVKVRCLDVFRTSLLALEEPRQCAVAGPSQSPFPGWMNIREVRWHHWGAPTGVWGRGVLRQIPARLLRLPHSPGPGPAVANGGVVGTLFVRLIPSELVDCGTSYFYRRMRVVSPFSHFTLGLPTCPDTFFGPGP